MATTRQRRKVKKVMHEHKHGTLKSGRSGRKVKSRKQAIAIAMSESGQSRKKRSKSGAKKSTRARSSKSSGSRKRRSK